MRRTRSSFLILAALPLLALGSFKARAASSGFESEQGCVARYLRLVQNDRIRSSEFARLKQGDPAAWDGWLRRSLQNGIDKDEALAVSAAVQGLDPASSARILSTIARRYPELPKKAPRFYGPKRVADIVMNSIFRPERYFEATAARKLSPEGALRAYFNRIREALAPSGAQSWMDVADLKAAALQFQRGLRESNTLSEAGHSASEPSVILFGSVMNGRGRPGKSDIDFIYGKNTRVLPIHDIKAGVDRELRSRHGAGLAGIEGMPNDLGDPGTKSLVNPIQLRITADKVEILVYPRPGAGETETFREPLVLLWF